MRAAAYVVIVAAGLDRLSPRKRTGRDASTIGPDTNPFRPSGATA
ncbi:hypothetical protein LC55x_4867 [Lysobacter capsici]|uniref:Uncharacterized protein n=1 Tax=Lysobacter capsici AZ78 TaxID=1444315 RepID=A0A108UBM1_9GAMM|nr:hypothetical protein LC55x_4867 [Lysobacter capsici]KWS06117.1 hypothetical protein AZ78_3671 [Lysobacter capsici AZ78]